MPQSPVPPTTHHLSHRLLVNVSDVVKAISDGKTQAEIDAIVDIIMGRK